MESRKFKPLKTTIYINGKCFFQHLSGVQRFAIQNIIALDKLLLSDPNDNLVFVLLTPDDLPDDISFTKIVVQKVRRFSLNLFLWEQILLPLYIANSYILCLGGSSPFFSLNTICAIHDDAIFSHPSAYNPLFVIWYRILFLKISLFSPYLITVSYFSKSRLARHFKKIPIKVIGNSAEHILKVIPTPSIRTKYGLNKPFMLAVSNPNPTKNIDYLLSEFLSSGLQQKYDLVLVGSPCLSIFSSSHQIYYDSVRRLGYVSDNELAALYLNAFCFIFPSLYEGFGIPPLEAMSLGCPVLASNFASIPEICENSALYFNPSLRGSLSSLLSSVHSNPTQLANITSNSSRTLSRYTWEKSAYNILSSLNNYTDIKHETN